MSGPESNLWRTFRANLSPFGMLRRIENSIDRGEGDVAYCLTRPKPGSIAATGFVELKVVDGYPARRSTPLRIDHLTKEQVLFAEDWAAAGGRAWLLLKIPPWHLLFDPAGIRGLYDRSILAADGPAVARFASLGAKFPTGGVLKCLTQ
jgi:hypothetical protein